MSRLYTNNYDTTVATALASGDTTLVVTDVTGLPTVGGGDVCRVTLDDATNIEIVEVTAVNATANSMTITRAQENTTALAFVTGTTVSLRSTADSLENVARLNDEDRVIDFGGAASLEIPNDAAPTVDAAGEIAIDTTITDHTGLITYHDGTEALYAVGLPTGNLNANDGYVVAYNATNNEFEMVAAGGGAIESLSNMTESTTFGVGDTISFDDHSFIESGNPYLTNGGPELIVGNYQFRKYGWQNVSSTIYPQIVGSSAAQYFGFSASGPKMQGAAAVYIESRATTNYIRGDLEPHLDSSYDLGTSSKAFQQIYTDSITFDGGTNSLDYYEDGSWTPVIAGSSVAGSHTYTVQAGVYERIGTSVICHFSIVISSVDAAMAGSVRITGLPFTAENVSGHRTAAAFSFLSNIAFTDMMTGRIVQNEAFVRLNDIVQGTASGPSDLTPSDFGSAPQLQGSIFFKV